VTDNLNEELLPDAFMFESSGEVLQEYLSKAPKKHSRKKLFYMLSSVWREFEGVLCMWKQNSPFDNECSKSCSLCCRMPVSCTPLECFACVEFIKSIKDSGLRVSLEESLRNYTNIPWEERWHGSSLISCPFLLIPDEGCFIYSVRPLPCRGYLCASRSTWEKVQKRGESVPIHGFLHQAYVALSVSLAALPLGVDNRPVSFIDTVLWLLNAHNCRNWMKGNELPKELLRSGLATVGGNPSHDC